MLIKITQGNYGYNNGDFVRVKTSSDKPFEVPDAEARRLERLGIAKIVGAGAVTLAKGSPDNEDPFCDPADDINVPVPLGDSEDEDDDAEYDEDDEDDVPEYGGDSTNAELQAIAKNYDIEVPPHANKAQLIAALDEFFYNTPNINAREPE